MNAKVRRLVHQLKSSEGVKQGAKKHDRGIQKSGKSAASMALQVARNFQAVRERRQKTRRKVNGRTESGNQMDKDHIQAQLRCIKQIVKK